MEICKKENLVNYEEKLRKFRLGQGPPWYILTQLKTYPFFQYNFTPEFILQKKGEGLGSQLRLRPLKLFLQEFKAIPVHHVGNRWLAQIQRTHLHVHTNHTTITNHIV